MTSSSSNHIKELLSLPYRWVRLYSNIIVVKSQSFDTIPIDMMGNTTLWGN